MDPANILFWNGWGYNGSGHQAIVRSLVAFLHIDVVCLQESKMDAISWVLVLQMLGPDFSNFVYILSIWASSGILIALKECLGFLGNSRVDYHSISVQFCPTGGTAWWLTCVYGTQGNEVKIRFLHELR
jgi:hypothetical protein